MNDEEPIETEEMELPISQTEEMFIVLHQEYIAAMNAGFSHGQAFKLTHTLFKARLEVEE